MSGLFRQLREDPATKTLLSNLGQYAGAQAGSLAGRMAGGGKSGDVAEGVVGEMSEAKAEGKSGPLAAIRGAIKGFFGGGGNKRPTNIYEQILIGVPVEVAFREWKRYAEFPKFMKGPESVSEQDEEGKTKWTAKIFVNRRSWTATVVEDIENYKIRWETEANKGTVDGTVTFHPLGDNLTAMVYVLEYRPKGFFEWWGNRWRTVGRRARLDVKHFGRYVTMQPTEEEESDDAGEETDVQSEAATNPEEATNERPDERAGADGGDEPGDGGDGGAGDNGRGDG